ncbi:uncharacterized protein DUF4252 [Hallella colorans]|uniref:Uncharacterized protein DUF4252 n=2 Tax=Hallella colorans TaxID=1703337 RepID=A0A2U0UJV3_9BACT|nr:uncharacterized protein DUF4252 [Hallella colorans]
MIKAMKKYFLIAIMMAITTLGNAQSTLFKKYENTKGVSIVTISKAMFRMMPTMKVGNKNLKKIASKIDHLQILSCERQVLNAKINKDVVYIYGKKPWEEVMSYRENGGNTYIYMRTIGNGKYEYALYTTEKGELQIISITGDLTLRDIQAIAK